MCRPKRPRASNAAILSNSFGVHRYEHCVLWCQWLDELAVSILGTKICFQRTQSLHYKAGGWRRSKSRVCQLGDCGSCPVWECCVLCFTLVSSEGNLQCWIMKPCQRLQFHECQLQGGSKSESVTTDPSLQQKWNPKKFCLLQIQGRKKVYDSSTR